MEPALGCIDVRDIGDPYTIRARGGELLLEPVRRDQGWFREPISWFAISSMSPDSIASHEPRHAIFATAFTELPEILENTRATVRFIAFDIRLLDQTHKPQVFFLSR